MTFDPRAEGFARPKPTEVQNAGGSKMSRDNYRNILTRPKTFMRYGSEV